MELSERTLAVIRKMFSPEQQREVAEFLSSECGANLPLSDVFRKRDFERIQLAVLKWSEGNMDGLLCAIQLAQVDWRDVLMNAGFGNNIKEHARWANEYLDQPVAHDS